MLSYLPLLWRLLVLITFLGAANAHGFEVQIRNKSLVLDYTIPVTSAYQTFHYASHLFYGPSKMSDKWNGFMFEMDTEVVSFCNIKQSDHTENYIISLYLPAVGDGPAHVKNDTLRTYFFGLKMLPSQEGVFEYVVKSYPFIAGKATSKGESFIHSRVILDTFPQSLCDKKRYQLKIRWYLSRYNTWLEVSKAGMPLSRMLFTPSRLAIGPTLFSALLNVKSDLAIYWDPSPYYDSSNSDSKPGPYNLKVYQLFFERDDDQEESKFDNVRDNINLNYNAGLTGGAPMRDFPQAAVSVLF